MSLFPENSKTDIALKHFHKPPNFYNCAQAIYKIFQVEYQITNNEITEFANDGYCGAYYSALKLLKNKPELVEEFTRRFQENSEYLTCFDIRFNTNFNNNESH